MEIFIFCFSRHSEFILELFYCTEFGKYTKTRTSPRTRARERVKWLRRSDNCGWIVMRESDAGWGECRCVCIEQEGHP
jgi:hypothetical protein